jgi:hypothetical protein
MTKRQGPSAVIVWLTGCRGLRRGSPVGSRVRFSLTAGHLSRDPAAKPRPATWGQADDEGGSIRRIGASPTVFEQARLNCRRRGYREIHAATGWWSLISKHAEVKTSQNICEHHDCGTKMPSQW